MTRAERRDLNRRAHAIRRAIVSEEWARARARGERARYRDIAPEVDAMPAADIVAAFSRDVTAAPMVATVTTTTTAPTGKRRAPAHVQRAVNAYRLALAAWERGLADAVAGGRTLAEGGRPARGEKYPDEERDYRTAHPRPSYRDFLRAECAAMRHGVAA